MAIKSLEAKLQKNRSITERLADDIHQVAGSFGFFVIHVVIFTVWVIANSGWISEIVPVDPFPFNFLTTVVSLEAIFLSIFVLMSQKRQDNIASLREEIHLQINRIEEQEVTKALQLISEIHQKIVANKGKDKEVEKMLRKLDTEEIEATLERQMEPQPMVVSELLEKAENRIFGNGKK
jgi:uncharacterized membrane protein